jgi:flagellar protein FlaG
MELAMGFEGNLVSQGFQPKAFEYSSAFSAPPHVRQHDSEKTKAESESRNDSDQKTLTAVEQANKLMELFNRDLHFETHQETGMLQISVVDKNDGKVIKQIPPDYVLNMVARIKDIIGGLMDVKA